MRDNLSNQGHVGHTGVRAAKYPNDKSPDKRESVSMKKPCAESIRQKSTASVFGVEPGDGKNVLVKPPGKRPELGIGLKVPVRVVSG
jgi:hypothetical protein